jgi:hypothetical protein
MHSTFLVRMQISDAYTIHLGCYLYSGRKLCVISTVELVNDVSDDKKFYKAVTGPLVLVRNAAGDGLFTVRSISRHRVVHESLTLTSVGSRLIKRSLTGVSRVSDPGAVQYFNY